MINPILPIAGVPDDLLRAINDRLREIDSAISGAAGSQGSSSQGAIPPGSGNIVPKFTGSESGSLTPSAIRDDGQSVTVTGRKVGIGTTAAPSQLLTLSKAASGNVGPVVQLENNSGALADAGAVNFSDGGALRAQLRFSVDRSPYGADLIYRGGGAGTTEVFRGTCDGRFGIGVPNPGYALDVLGDTNTSAVFRAGGSPGLGPSGPIIVALAKLTSGGVGGSISIRGGIVIGYVPPT